jgi:hypothetical protein
MRRWVFLFLVAALAVGGMRAQHEHHGMAQKTATGVKLEVKSDAAAHVVAVRLGPLNLPARSDHMAIAQAPHLFWVVPFDGWLIAYHPRLVDDAGNLVPGRLLHHVAFWNTRRSDFLCPNKQEHIFGAGGEMNDWPGIAGYGYRVAKGDRMRIETMFHNPTDTAYPRTYLEVRIEYRARGVGNSELTNVYPTWFDVMECGHSAYDLEPGRSVTVGEITLRYSGTLLGVGGHLHDYGQRLVLENLTRKEEVAALSSNLDPHGRIVSMPVVTFLGPAAQTKSAGRGGGYRLTRGERIRVTATYDNPTGESLSDGDMGIVVGYFVPENDAQMAALQRKHK